MNEHISVYPYKVVFYDSGGEKVTGQNISPIEADRILKAKNKGYEIKVSYLRKENGSTTITLKQILE